MQLTKFQHACLALEKNKTGLVIDPGAYSHDFFVPDHVDGIIITHDHPDHLDTNKINQILRVRPKATIIGHESITAQFPNATTLAVVPGQTYKVADFSLRFFGGEHAPIAEGVATPPNLGVLIDDSLYYPGDSFTSPVSDQISVTTLALPISAPWLDFARTRDFLQSVRPKFVFPTHDGILSEDGKQLAEKMVGGFAESQGITYKRLDGQSVELA